MPSPRPVAPLAGRGAYAIRVRPQQPCSWESAPPGVGHHARGARHSVFLRNQISPNAGALSSHEDWESCARCPTHGEQILHSTVARMPPRANTEDAGNARRVGAASATSCPASLSLTTGTGRFNLVRGAIGTLIAIAASISTTATGFLFEALGQWEGFLILAAASAVATMLLWAAMPETIPAKYLD